MKWLLWIVGALLVAPMAGVAFLASRATGGIGGALIAAAHDPVLVAASQNSAIVSIVSAAVSTLVAFFLRSRQILGSGTRPPAMNRWVMGALIAPIAVPDLFLAIAYANGLTLWRVRSGVAPLIACYLVTGVPLAFLLLSQIEDRRLASIVSAARDLGAPGRIIVGSILWPLSRGVLAGCMTLLALLYLNEFVIAFFLLGPGQATIPVVFYSALRFGVGPKIYVLSTMIILLSIAGGVALYSSEDTTQHKTRRSA